MRATGGGFGIHEIFLAVRWKFAGGATSGGAAESLVSEAWAAQRRAGERLEGRWTAGAGARGGERLRCSTSCCFIFPSCL